MGQIKRITPLCALHVAFVCYLLPDRLTFVLVSRGKGEHVLFISLHCVDELLVIAGHFILASGFSSN